MYNELLLIMITKYLEKAILAAVEAGRVIHKIYVESEDFGVITKADDSPLTIADKAGHDVIVEQLKDLGIPMLSEEGESIGWETRKEWSTFWCIDPLDGTKEFINRNGEFTVNIALIQDGQPIMGVVYLPVTKELYYGSKENGAFKKLIAKEGDELLALKDAEKLPNMETKIFTIIASKSHLSPETKDIIDACKERYQDVEIISCGSSKKLCLLAEGRVNLYPRIAPTMEWDTAAAHAVVTAAGREIVDFDSKEELRYNKENLLNPYFMAFDSKFNLND